MNSKWITSHKYIMRLFVLFVFVLSSKNVHAKPAGQFFWHLPRVVSFSDSSFSGVATVTPGFFGLTRTLGSDARPAHLADFSLDVYNISVRRDSDDETVNEITREWRLGYVYHYSNNYNNASEPSDNVHVGFGLARYEGSSDIFNLGGSYSANGQYFRIGYFRAIPLASSDHQFLIGINFEVINYSRGSQSLGLAGLLIDELGLDEGNLSPNPYFSPRSNISMSLLLGRNF